MGRKLSWGWMKDIQEKQRSTALLFSSQLPPPFLSRAEAWCRSLVGILVGAASEFMEALKRVKLQHRKGNKVSYGLCRMWLQKRGMNPTRRDGRQLSPVQSSKNLTWEGLNLAPRPLLVFLPQLMCPCSLEPLRASIPDSWLSWAMPSHLWPVGTRAVQGCSQDWGCFPGLSKNGAE